MISLSNAINPKPFWKHNHSAFTNHVTSPILRNTDKLHNLHVTRHTFQTPTSLSFTVEDEEPIDDKKEKIKAYKLRLRPTKQQKLMLNKWAGNARFLYNKAIFLRTKTNLNKFQLRNRLATIKNRESGKNNSFYNNKPWLKDCPSSVRKSAVYDAVANLQSCFSNKNISQFTLPFRTKKREQQNGYGFSIEKQDIKKQKDKLYIAGEEFRYYGTKQLHKLVPGDRPDHDCKVQRSAFGEYFLIVPYRCHGSPVPKVFTNPISIDVGVRKNMTTYAPNKGESLFVGDRWIDNAIMPLLLRLDQLYSDRKKNKEEILRLRKRVFYLKKEFRDQAASYISKNHDLVLMSKLDTKELSIKAERRLKTKTVRAMLNIGHSKLFDAMKDKCWEHGSKFLHVGEEYTSQTCPCCGRRKKTSSETYSCCCGFEQDRDIVGALNILIKAIV